MAFKQYLSEKYKIFFATLLKLDNIFYKLYERCTHKRRFRLKHAKIYKASRSFTCVTLRVHNYSTWSYYLYFEYIFVQAYQVSLSAHELIKRQKRTIYFFIKMYLFSLTRVIYTQSEIPLGLPIYYFKYNFDAQTKKKQRNSKFFCNLTVLFLLRKELIFSEKVKGSLASRISLVSVTIEAGLKSRDPVTAGMRSLTRTGQKSNQVLHETLWLQLRR